jgi:two-component system, OmpR family, sensor kinase
MNTTTTLPAQAANPPQAAGPRIRLVLDSLRARVLALVAGFGLLTALALSLVMFHSVKHYYVNTQYSQGGEFLERVLRDSPDIWSLYEANKKNFSERLARYTLYTPSSGLYLLDNEGRVLASSGEGKIFWSSYRVNVQAVAETMRRDPDEPVYGQDPDTVDGKCIVTARPVMVGTEQTGWLYMVVRSADLGSNTPAMLKSYAIRTAIKVGLLTLAIGVVLTMLMLAVLTKPLMALTKIVEQVKAKGFQTGFPMDLCGQLSSHAARQDEVGKLSRSFNEMLERLRQEMQRVTQADGQRREMVASVSHDLRTPLTALIGQLETVRLKRATMTHEDQAQFIDRALMNAQHLKRLTDALAELARLDNPEFRAQTEPMMLCELADDVVQRYASRAEEAGVTLNIEYLDHIPQANIDAQLIERALSNLLDNALRVTPASGSVTVQVAFNANSGYRVIVKDSGPGLPESEQTKVFERFYQSSAHRETRGSSGLGLAIVKRVAELHGGRAGVESELGKGAAFYLTLPA